MLPTHYLNQCWLIINGPLTRYIKLWVVHAPGTPPGSFSRHRLQRKSLVSDSSMHHGTCVTHVPWCMSGSLTRVGGENVPVIPGACVTRNFTYLARGSWDPVAARGTKPHEIRDMSITTINCQVKIARSQPPPLLAGARMSCIWFFSVTHSCINSLTHWTQHLINASVILISSHTLPVAHFTNMV